MAKKRTILRKIGRAALYVLFFLVATFLFTYWTLPFESIRDRYLRIAENKLGMEIVGKIEKSWFTGIRGSSLRLIPRSKPKPGAKKVPEMEIEELTARLAILPLFLGRLKVTFGAKLGSGGLEGSFTRRGRKSDVELTLDKLDLKLLKILESIREKGLEGTISGSATVSVGREITAAQGKAALTGAGLKMGEFKVPVAQWGNAPVTVPALSLGNLRADLEVGDGALTFKDFRLEGSPDLEASAKGYLLLITPLARSNLRAYVKFRFSDSFFKRNPKFRALEGVLQPAKRPDGYYGYLVSGPIGIPARLSRVAMPRDPPGLVPPKRMARPPTAGPLRPPRRTPVPAGVRRRLGRQR